MYLKRHKAMFAKLMHTYSLTMLIILAGKPF